MLVEGFIFLPLEGFNKFLRGDVAVSELQLGEQLLQLEEDAVLSLGMYLFVIGPLVDSLSELRSHEESLEEAVYVASGAYVRQSFIIG